ncbi:MAG: nucleotidyl transferase AbiEii/AbiGii toxin family protein [Flavobacteriales bacterium]
MLHTKTVSPRLLEVLSAVMNDPVFDGFALAGGTALALQIGHRQSIDIDLFGKHEIDEPLILAAYSTLGTVTKLKRSPSILICSVDGIKIDLVSYTYPLIKPVQVFNGLRLLSISDIAAMKLNAIAGRGSRKYFIDLYFLLRLFTLDELLAFYSEKYPDGSEFLVMKSLTYFDDADRDVEPILFESVEWSAIKSYIRSLL